MAVQGPREPFRQAILRVASRRVRSDFVPRLRAETSAFMKGAKPPLKALAPKQMKTKTTACRHAPEPVRGPDTAADVCLPVGRGVFQQPGRIQEEV